MSVVAGGHLKGPNETCLTCGAPWPCPNAREALQGLFRHIASAQPEYSAEERAALAKWLFFERKDHKFCASKDGFDIIAETLLQCEIGVLVREGVRNS